ncbi:beta,beta-carotene 9',10'-dioxygenase [Amniculicola lignicola CBS 123094]|uniref:Beta,beta-carotene 9',10'-dioxygenase n=1 Tax=Amniculicola lignicola CBS 123094 TaxID=1392246 RepID=A0A6A5WBS7_9PLEO|nr:beta,beta-carotene 9',10'-dioxygenase [Amniculicola lignicola CBS 123094]
MASWPNDDGFDTDYQQPEPVPLAVKGTVPHYAAGVLYRTGPLGYKVPTSKGKTWSANHWFDGLSCVHRFQIEFPEEQNGEAVVTYRSRRTVDEYLDIVQKTGRLDGITFGAKRDPCKTFFHKVMSMFKAERNSQNVGVTLSINMPGGGCSPPSEKALLIGSHSNGIETLHAKTDASIVKKIDPETLEPEGVALQTKLHPDLKGPFSASHAKSDPLTGDIFNFNLDCGRKCTYRIFCTSAATGNTSILTTFPGQPAYLHSLFLTKSYVILCVWNSHITWHGLSTLYHKNIVQSIAPFDASKKAVWYVVDRHAGKGLVATYETDPFFSFHTINAWEQPSATGGIDIIAELVTYENLDVIHRFYYDNVISSHPSAQAYTGHKRDTCMPSLTQYRLPGVADRPVTMKPRKGEVVFQAPKLESMELPTINPAYLTKRHRYIYGCADRLKSSFMDGLVKFDNITQTAVFWEVEGHTPGEPIFVGNPEGEEEDDGVLLSVVLDGFRGKSYLVVLSARDLTEVGRAEMEGPMAFGFHGAFKGRRRYGGDI